MASILLPVLAATALAAPQLGDDLSTVDVGVAAGPGTGVYAIFVAPDAWVEDCTVLKSDYSARINDRICTQLLLEKARKAARGPDGKPIHAVAVVSRNGGAAPHSLLPADIVLEVENLPGGVGKAVDIEVLVDHRGKVTACEPADGADAALARTACEYAGRYTLDRREDRDGLAVPYLAELRVDFVRAEATS